MSTTAIDAVTSGTIRDMEPGLEMDRLVAGRVMGLTVVSDPVNYRGLAVGSAGADGKDLAHYSTNIEAAFGVVAHLRERGYCFDVEACACDAESIDRGAQGWPFVRFSRNGHHINEHYPRDEREWHAFSRGPDHHQFAACICRAALLTTL